ncbi:MAG: YqzE family protein [Bacillaceae bacterium]
MANDYVKYFTVQAVSYMNTTKEERKQKKEEKHQMKDPFSVRWFGMMPMLSFAVFKSKFKKT